MEELSPVKFKGLGRGANAFKPGSYLLCCILAPPVGMGCVVHRPQHTFERARQREQERLKQECSYARDGKPEDCPWHNAQPAEAADVTGHKFRVAFNEFSVAHRAGEDSKPPPLGRLQPGKLGHTISLRLLAVQA